MSYGSRIVQKQKVPRGYSPADESAGSFTPFGMTVFGGGEL
jgi:hypothetical protein